MKNTIFFYIKTLQRELCHRFYIFKDFVSLALNGSATKPPLIPSFSIRSSLIIPQSFQTRRRHLKVIIKVRICIFNKFHGRSGRRQYKSSSRSLCASWGNNTRRLKYSCPDIYLLGKFIVNNLSS